MSTLAVSTDPRARSARCTDDELIVQLADGRTLAVPLVWFFRGSRRRTQTVAAKSL